MTRGKCKKVLQALWRYKDCGYSENEIRESLDIAIKALEQETCEDCVSREAVKELFQEGDVMGVYEFLGIDDLPTVRPTHKKGKWIPCRAKYDKTVSVYECNICHKNNGFENSKYCPHCGSEMEREE